MQKTAFILPQPGPELKEHSARLAEKILDRISVDGPVSFHDYMEMALYEPGLGYYSAGMTKFGREGDFVTAPELGPLFARCLGRTVNAAASHLGAYSVLELGAGSGRLAVDLLDCLSANPPETYFILERSADMRDRQQQLLNERHPGFSDRVQWLQQPPASFDGIIIGNEIVDALPVERFSLAAGEVRQCLVGEQAGRLQELIRPAPADLARQVTGALPVAIDSYPDDYQSEINLYLPAWLDGITRGLGSGLVILCDYGYVQKEYYHPERSRGTLLCHYRHRAHDDALFWPGLQDITASVDFTALAEAGTAANLDLLAYTSQAGFLIDAGLPEMLEDPSRLDERGRLTQADQVKKLTLPGEMGERFQFMLMGRNLPGDLPGMNGPDYRYRL